MNSSQIRSQRRPRRSSRPHRTSRRPRRTSRHRRSSDRAKRFPFLTSTQFAKLVSTLAHTGDGSFDGDVRAWMHEHRDQLSRLRRRLDHLPTATTLRELMEIAHIPGAHFDDWCRQQTPETLKALRTLLRGGHETREEHDAPPSCSQVAFLIEEAMKRPEMEAGLNMAAKVLSSAEKDLKSDEAKNVARDVVLGPSAVVIGKNQSSHQQGDFISCLRGGKGEECCAELGNNVTRQACQDYIEKMAHEIENELPEDANKLRKWKRALSVVGVLIALGAAGGAAYYNREALGDLTQRGVELGQKLHAAGQQVALRTPTERNLEISRRGGSNWAKDYTQQGLNSLGKLGNRWWNTEGNRWRNTDSPVTSVTPAGYFPRIGELDNTYSPVTSVTPAGYFLQKSHPEIYNAITGKLISGR